MTHLQASTAATLERSRISGLLSRKLAHWARLPFFQSHDRRAFVFQDRLIGVDADEQLRTQLASLEHRAGVAYAIVSISRLICRPWRLKWSYRGGKSPSTHRPRSCHRAPLELPLLAAHLLRVSGHSWRRLTVESCRKEELRMLRYRKHPTAGHQRCLFEFRLETSHRDRGELASHVFPQWLQGSPAVPARACIRSLDPWKSVVALNKAKDVPSKEYSSWAVMCTVHIAQVYTAECRGFRLVTLVLFLC